MKDASIRKADARSDYLKNTQYIVFETAASKLKIACQNRKLQQFRGNKTPL
jgi:hypothetical protein